MSESRGASKLETAVAALVGGLALVVSAYTAYLQRQQVQAAVWPTLDWGNSDVPYFRINLANKGVGPALVKHVVVTVDGQPVHDWGEVARKLDPTLDAPPIVHSDIASGSRVLSPGESVEVFVPKADGDGGAEDEARVRQVYVKGAPRIGAEICYCSTLGDCWTLVDPGNAPPMTTEAKGCPTRSERTFRE